MKPWKVYAYSNDNEIDLWLDPDKSFSYRGRRRHKLTAKQAEQLGKELIEHSIAVRDNPSYREEFDRETEQMRKDSATDENEIWMKTTSINGWGK